MIQVIFGTVRSYDDLGMVLTDAKVSLPEAKRTLVDVPGADGQLDLTGEVRFRNRTITLSFAMADYHTRWLELFSGMASALHGRHFKVFIEPETQWYWDAFCIVRSAQCDRNRGLVIVELDADPYMHQDVSILVEAVQEGAQVICPNAQQRVIPSFTSQAPFSVTFSGEEVSFDAGTHSSSSIRLEPGDNALLIKGSDDVAVSYRKGIL